MLLLFPATQFARHVHDAQTAGTRARLDGSGTTTDVPAKADVVAAQVTKNEISETGTKRLTILSTQSRRSLTK